MVTLQEQFEKDFPDKSVREIVVWGKYKGGKFTNRDLDLREYVNLTILIFSSNNLTSLDVSKNVNLDKLCCAGNKLTSVDFLNTIPNPEKLEYLEIFSNNIRSTDISVFSKFVNLKFLKTGTTKHGLSEGKRNKFYGSLKSYQNLTKLEETCIEATDVNEGLEYLPMSLVENTSRLAKTSPPPNKFRENGGAYSFIECSPLGTNAKCSQIQNELRPFNYDLEA